VVKNFEIMKLFLESSAAFQEDFAVLTNQNATSCSAGNGVGGASADDVTKPNPIESRSLLPEFSVYSLWDTIWKVGFAGIM
jgi:hypothetical protein